MTADAVASFAAVATGLREAGRPLRAGEMSVRAVVAFAFAMLLLRVGRRRLMADIGPFDLVVTLVLGSTLSRGITGNAPFLPVLAACCAVVAAHGLVAFLSARSTTFSRWVQGVATPLVAAGRIDRGAMRLNDISDDDLLETLRLRGKTGDVGRIASAHLERSGKISVIREGGDA